MTTKPDCSAIEQANTQLDERIISFDSELDEMRNLLRSLYPDDPQRPDVLRKLDVWRGSTMNSPKSYARV